ncbi:MAG: ABC transporter ATP-binding protein [Roseburia sp.]|nr:ABC transporter ATP-binding protein [Roseburia sp.]
MRYIKAVLKKNKVMVLAYLLIGLGNAFLENFKADFYRRIVDGLAERNLALTGILLYGAILIANYLLNYAEEYPAKKLQHGIYLDFKLLALEKISRMDYQEYQKNGTGKLVQRIENGAEAGKNVLYDFWFAVLRQLLPTIGFALYFIRNISPAVTGMILSGYLFIFLVTNILLKALYRLKEKILNQEERLNHFLVRGFMEMLVFRMERQFPGEIQKAKAAKEEIVSSKVKMNLIHEAFFTIFALLVAVLDIGILIYVWSSQSVSVGSVVALLTLIENAYTPIAIFNVLYVQYKLDLSAYRRYTQFLQTKEDAMLEQGSIITKLQGEICVRNLTFAYKENFKEEGKTSENLSFAYKENFREERNQLENIIYPYKENSKEERKLLENLSFAIRKGEKVAFVGESGSGKSTLAKLLAGLLKYEDGSIQIDGKELKELNLNHLYGSFNYLSQDAPVFDGTIRENLVFGRNVPEEKLNKAMEKMQLSPLLGNLRNGLETEIGERGTALSGGEKQRLAMARLLLKENHASGITILDEATSAMDNLTEKQVMAEILSHLKNQTVIAIAHRINSVADFDKILVFHQGKIIGQGTFPELMKNNLYFQKLYLASQQPE